MPSKNAVKHFANDTYYHVYNRGVDKRKVFLDDEDYQTFTDLLARYLSDKPAVDKVGRQYDYLGDQLEIAAYCIMPNHFHILLFQIDAEAMTKVLRAVTGSYTVYFNHKYDRSGTLFQGVYKASRIDSEAYLEHISIYIHQNPDRPYDWRWSSLGAYSGGAVAKWLHPELLIEPTDAGRSKYAEDMNKQQNINDIETMLADR